MISFTIERRALGWNKFMRMHFRARHKLNEDWVTETMRCMHLVRADFSAVRLPIKIEVTTFSKSPLDADNILDKVIIDGIKQVAGFDDCYKNLMSVETCSKKVIKGEPECIKIIIKDQDDYNRRD